MGSRFVTATHDLLSEIRSGRHGLGDHERTQFDPMLVHEIEYAGNPLVMTIGKKRIGR